MRRELLHILEQAHSLASILEAATRLIASRLDADHCSAFLVDPQGELTHYGADAGVKGADADEEMARVAAEVVATRHRVARQGVTNSTLATPLLLRDRMMGALVLLRSNHAEFTASDVETLATAGAQLVGIVEIARIIDALDQGERPTVEPSLGAPSIEPTDGERILRGVSASPGIAIGAAVFRGAILIGAAAAVSAGPVPAERLRLRTAIEKTRNDLLRIQTAGAREVDEEHALIFASHLLLLNDPTLLDRIDRHISSGISAPAAADKVLEEFAERLRLVPDPYLREKSDDIADLRSRLLGHMLATSDRTVIGRRVVLSSSIQPSLVMELKAEGAQAVVAQVGSATSHGVLLARAMRIPAVAGVSEMLTVAPGDCVIVDGTAGVVVVRPTEATLAHYVDEQRRAEQMRTEYAKFRDVPGQTADGARVSLYANVGVASDLVVARDNGAEGIGLYRTEFPFIVRDAFPTRDEQVRIYRKAYELFPIGRINFRILDLGGDKFVSGGSMKMARNAFHGYRSMRVLFDHPDVLRDQVQALALAAEGRPLRILIPMVTSLEELRRTKAMISEALDAIDGPQAQRAPQIGAMIEVPAAVEIVGEIAKHVDFLSIGTNDLMQYALVVDREDARMASLSDPYHPAILRMIARVVAAAREAGKTVSVCGEIATRPEVALALIALGIDSLSMVPTAIPELKQALASARLGPLRDAIGGILTLPDSLAIASALREALAA